MYFIVDKMIFLLSVYLWFGAHIDTGVIDFLNDSDCIFVEFVLHCSLRLLFEQRKKETKTWPTVGHARK